MKTEVYLDNNATTHLSGAVRESLCMVLSENLGNASSSHRSGEKTRRLICQARESVANLAGANTENVVFGSGVTELNFWVISKLCQMRARAHLITSAVEHSCVLRTADWLELKGVEVTRLPVDPSGRIDVGMLAAAVNRDTALVSIQWVNNETGVVQPIYEISQICYDANVPFHCDAAQAFGKMEINFAGSCIDYMTVSAHKMHGPSGIGAICLKAPKTLDPLLQGGDQERGLRPGTENVLGIIGFGQAAKERAESLSAANSFVANLRDRFEWQILSSVPQVKINGCMDYRVCNTTNMMFPGLDGAAIVAMLDRDGIRCSQSSACTSNQPEPSYVLRAMGLSEEEAYASVRFSFSNQNTIAEVDFAASKVISIVEKFSGVPSRLGGTDSWNGAV